MSIRNGTEAAGRGDIIAPARRRAGGMTTERWQKIEELYHAAAELEPDRRSSFLDEACCGDDALRAEIESLLRFKAPEGPFLDQPALEIAAQLEASREERLTVGRTLGPYRIIKL